MTQSRTKKRQSMRLIKQREKRNFSSSSSDDNKSFGGRCMTPNVLAKGSQGTQSNSSTSSVWRHRQREKNKKTQRDNEAIELAENSKVQQVLDFIDCRMGRRELDCTRPGTGLVADYEKYLKGHPEPRSLWEMQGFGPKSDSSIAEIAFMGGLEMASDAGVVRQD